MLRNGNLLAGTVDTVTRQLERPVNDTPTRRLSGYLAGYATAIPHEVNMKSIELFKARVLPRFA